MEPHEISLTGEIGDDALVQTIPGEDPPIIGPKFLRKQLNQVPPKTKELHIYIQSRGGEVDAGFAMYDLIDQWKRKTGIQVNTIITGFVKSIATVPFLAGDRRFISPAAVFMIHNPWSMGIGDADEFQELSDSLRAAENRLADFYHEKTGFNINLIKAKMKKETDFTLEEAIRYGFATDKLEDESDDALESIKNRANKIYALSGVARLNKSQKPMTNKKPKPGAKGKKQGDRITKLMAMVSNLLNLAGDNQVKNLELELEDGTRIFTDAEEAETLENFGAWAVDDEGNPTDPLEDGDYQLSDGRTITVAEGMISAVTAAPEETQDEMVNKRLDQMEEMITALAESVKAGKKKPKDKKAGDSKPKPKKKASGAEDDDEDDDDAPLDIKDLKKDLKAVHGELVNIKKNMASAGGPGTGRTFSGPPNQQGVRTGSTWANIRNELRGNRKDPRYVAPSNNNSH